MKKIRRDEIYGYKEEENKKKSVENYLAKIKIM